MDKIKNLKVEMLWSNVKQYVMACGALSKVTKYRKSIEETHGEFSPQHKYGGYASNEDIRRRKRDIIDAMNGINRILIELGVSPITIKEAEEMQEKIVGIYGVDRNIYYTLIENHRKHHEVIRPTELIPEFEQKLEEKRNRRG